MADSTKVITNKLNTAIRRKLNSKLIPRMGVASRRINERLGILIKKAVFNSPEIQAIIRGQEGITGELGMDPSEEDLRGRFNAIVEEWSKTIKTTFVPLRKGDLVTSKPNLRVVALNLDFTNLLSLPEAQFVTPENSFVLPWLEWLLIRGDAVISDVEPFGFKDANRGRTGLGIMIRGNDKFKIPSAFSGTINNNILTRAVDQIRTQDIKNIVIEEITRVIK